MVTGSLVSCVAIVLAVLACLLIDRSKQEDPANANFGFGLELILTKLEEMNLRIMNLEQQNRELTEMLNKTVSCSKPTVPQPTIASVKSNQTSSGVEIVAPQAFDEADVYRSCSEIPLGKAGKYLLRPVEDSEPFYGLCDNTYGNGWMVVQNRFNGSENFYRNWTDYKNGFGSWEGEFWYGLDRIHLFTSNRKHEIMFELMSSGGTVAAPRYNHFDIGNETEDYKIKDLGSFSGSGGDSFSYHKGMKFSTHDRDNDQYNMNCAKNYYGAWWYKSCYHSNLNGKYISGQVDHKSMCWNSFPKSNEGLQRSKIMIREV
ncbi:microfibril-associated glycoprotein 4-like [Wyeomyia smithii]|uniref:microfibril-associated glycoprotein 4-like n=1 Tax=Wyeomyia smithii TaxID=174621 RepID=UPI002467CEC6|nr:microfibril-associated glycoprotein 4-like [Wyeomyia smithii]